jgi:transketolase
MKKNNGKNKNKAKAGWKNKGRKYMEEEGKKNRKKKENTKKGKKEKWKRKLPQSDMESEETAGRFSSPSTLAELNETARCKTATQR